MRLLAPSLCAILALAVPLQAGGTPAGPAAALLTPGDDGAPPIDAPFLRAPPSAWLPALREHGLAAAYRAASAGAGGEDAAARSDDVPAVPVVRDLLPLGDADRDGRHDVIVAAYDVEGKETTFTALSGARAGQAIWTRGADNDEMLYLVGDVDEDGVLDIAFADDVDFAYDESAEEYRLETRHRILSGRDLAPLADMVLETTERWTGDEDPLPPFVFGRSSQTQEVDIPLLVDLWREPGYAVATLHFTQNMESEGLLLKTSDRQTFQNGISIARHALDGSQMWKAGDRDTVLRALLDADGDGQADLVFGRGFDETTSYRGSGDELDRALGGREDESREVSVLVVDADDGATVWETGYRLEADMLMLETLGNIYGEGPALGVVAWRMRPYSGGMMEEQGIRKETDLRFLDAATGKEQDAHVLEDQLATVFRHGDADGDGRDDILLYSIKVDGRPTLAATDPALDPTWKMRMPGNAWGHGDLDGDDVPDILLREDDDLAAYHGTDASIMWELEVDDAVATAVVYDLDLDGGRDIAVLRMQETGRAVDGGSLDFLNGAAGTLVWTKPTFNGTLYEDVAAERFGLASYAIGDLDGDGAMDPFVHVTGSCAKRCGAEGHAHDLDTVMGLDAVDAHAFLRFDNMPMAPGAEVVDAPAVVGPAGKLMESRLDTGIPGLGLVLAALGLLALVGMVRRR